jgi:metal-responsive CopG/Arc/MetJ family transcriptional regulator
MKTKTTTKTKRPPPREALIRLPLPIHPALLKQIAACVPLGQSRSEWMREAIRQRILRDGPRQL